jgi:hypothetical protein
MTCFLGNGGRDWERIKDYFIKSCADSLEYFISVTMKASRHIFA